MSMICFGRLLYRIYNFVGENLVVMFMYEISL